MRAALFVLVLCAAPGPAPAQSTAPPDSVATPILSFDLITRETFVRRHAFSLDHFLEFEPGGVVARLGPIGNDAYFSRWGIGRGRVVFIVNGIPLNNPQDGTAPLVDIATSGLAQLSLDGASNSARESGIEGTIEMREMVARPSRPHTFIELSKGTNELRQRRVRFGSEAGRIGLDLSYDEVLDDGYNFDANDILFPQPAPEGRALSRNAAVVVRGDLEERARYAIGLRRFRSSSTGDLVSAANEATRGGHLAWATAGVGPVEATAYGRGYSSDRADSATTNESAGGVVSWNQRYGDTVLRVFALGEHTNATQSVAGAEARTRTSLGSGGAGVESRWAGATWFAHGSAAFDEQQGAWGAAAGARLDIPRGDVAVSARRAFRLPSIGERYLPSHTRDGYTISGDDAIDPEVAWEGSAAWTLRAGAVTNRVRGSWIRSEDYISFAIPVGETLSRRAANSSREPSMSFFEERIAVAAKWGKFELGADAGGTYATGDREGAFQSVPRTQVNASLVVGRSLFEASSALYLEGSYAFMDERRDYNGVPLSSYQVVNVGIVGRLIDVRVYLKWLNLLDESYQTVSGYLMTPNTLAYGIEWTLFD